MREDEHRAIDYSLQIVAYINHVFTNVPAFDENDLYNIHNNC